MIERMSVTPSSAGVSERMSRQLSRGTTPETLLRKALHARGLRFRIHVKVPGRLRREIDVAFPRARVAVFVDGCFWHACPEHRTQPKANSDWWRTKLESNVTRDRDTDAALAAGGWTVVRVWEHEPAAEAAARIAEVVAARRG